MHRVVLIPGDGIGPSISDVAVRVIEASGVAVEWVRVEAGMSAIDKYKDPLPEEVLEAIRETRVALKGPLTTPVGSGFRSVNVALRKEFDLYANVRPCVSLAVPLGLPRRLGCLVPQGDTTLGVRGGATLLRPGGARHRDHGDPPAMERNAARTQPTNGGHVVAHKQDGSPFLGYIAHLTQTPLLKCGISYSQNFIHY